MFRFYYLIIFLVVFPHMCNAQNNDLLKNWVMNQAYDCEGNILNRMAETYWNVDFKSNGIATLNISGQNLKIEKEYTLIDTKLNLEFEEYIITKITKDTLILKGNKKSCKKFLFISHEANVLNEKKKKDTLIKQSSKFFIHKGDTVYFANSYNSPKMKKYPSYMEYFIKAFPNMNKTKGCIILFQFIVLKNGQLLDAKGSISCLEKSDKKVEQIIKNMANKWEPMYINGKPVNSLMRVRFRHN